ncbi:unnamed protein product [Withania somnifera]
MVYHSESITRIKIGVFKWTQNMIKNRILVHHHQLRSSSSRFKFFFLRVKNQMRMVKPRNCDCKNRGGQTKKRTFKKSVQIFKICENSEEFVESIGFALGLSDFFFKETIPYLGNTICDYLSSSFGKNLNFLSNMDDEFNKIILTIDVDMESGRFEIGSQKFNSYKYLLTDLYKMLVNDGDNNKDKEGEFYLQIDKFQEYCVGISKKSRIDVNMPTLANDDDSRNKEGEFYLQVEDGARKKRRLRIRSMIPIFDEIVDTLLDFLTNKRGFHNKVEVFDGKIQKFREKNAMSSELRDICPICFEIFKEKSVVVVTPCSHIFHRIVYLHGYQSCPICRESCNV